MRRRYSYTPQQMAELARWEREETARRLARNASANLTNGERYALTAAYGAGWEHMSDSYFYPALATVRPPAPMFTASW